MVKSIKESRSIAREQLEKLLEEAGSQVQLARMLSSDPNYSITPQGVIKWFKSGQISKQGALAVVNHPHFSEKFTLNKLRPDIPSDDWGFDN